MARSRAGTKAPEKEVGKSVKLNISLTPDLARRLGIHAEMAGISKSDLVAKLIAEGCRRYVVHDRDREPKGQGGETEATDAA